MPELFLAIVGLGLVGFGLLAFVYVMRAFRTDELSGRLKEYVIEPGAPARSFTPMPDIRKKELSGSILARTIVPAFKRMGRFLGRLTPAGTLDELSRQLTIAGNPMGLGAREFYGVRLLFTGLAFFLAFSTLREGLNLRSLFLSAILLIVTSNLPKMWLRSRVRSRQNKIRKGLPDALDMLSVCADAGLGFDQSMQRVSEHWDTPLAVEFRRVVSEMEMGISRQRAMRNVAERLDVAELSSFVAVILQSDQLGMSISETLHSQAIQMREERRFRAQEEARKLPLKMLMPMLLFIFPAMMAVVLGPIVPTITDVFGLMLSNIR
jgi:tight adherence protein C